jgi:hypothetical protein
MFEIGRAGLAKNAGEFSPELEILMSTIRTTSNRGRGGAIPKR